MPKRLLIVIDEMEIGGSQRNIVDMARSLDPSAYALSLVFFRKPSAYVDELRRLGVEVVHIPKRGKLDPVFFLRLCRYLGKNDFDVIHAFSFSGELWTWYANLLTRNTPFVSTVHSVYEWYSPLQWMFKRWIALGSAAIVANSQAGADYAALRAGIRRSRIDVVRNGIELSNFNNTVPPAPGDEPLRILFVGRLVAHKNLGCLLQGMAEVAKDLGATQLDIVGDGPLRSELETTARELKIDDRVHFHGERDDVGAFLARSAIFVMPSHREGLSNAIMEAMSAGLPVVASNVGGNPELVVHDRTGLLFPPDDHESLGDMLLELVNDAEKRQRFSEQARIDSQRFHGPRQMTAELESIYARCLYEADAEVARRRNTTG